METVASIVRMIEGPLLALEAKNTDLTVIGVLDSFFAKIKFDKKLNQAIYQYQIGYINTSKEYVDFFGSNLLGVQVIRFREIDVLRFFNDVLEIDFYELTDKIRETTVINHTYKVSGDIFNLTLMYMVHRCLSDKLMKERDRVMIAHNTALVFFYRAIAAILSAYFKYPTDPKIAQVAYANLSAKYLIKKLGSWQQVMDYRATELISKTGTQYNKLVKLKDDLDLVDVINDCANSIKDMIKNYYAEFIKAHSQGDNIGVTRTTGLDAQGQEVVYDRIRNVDKSVAIIRQYVSDQDSFVREDFIRVISDINKNTSPRLIRETLIWVSSHAVSKDFKLIDQTVSAITIYSFYLIDTRMEPSRIKDMFYVMTQLKNLYLSSRSTDTDLIHIRKLCDQILNKAHKDLSQPLILSTRTAFILYVTLLVLAGQKNH